nr:MAG TPA: hypothetical protein [Caudoviricetes sp.]
MLFYFLDTISITGFLQIATMRYHGIYKILGVRKRCFWKE